MKLEAIRSMMMAMKPESKPSKVLLVAHSRDARSTGVAAPIRRFRIARLRADNRPATVQGGAASRTPSS